MEYNNLVELYERLEKTTKRLEKTFYIYELLKKTTAEDLGEIMLLLQGKVFPTWDSRVIGFASRLIVKAIHTATGISTKEIEEQWKKTGDLGITAEKLIAKKKQRTLSAKDLTVRKVFDNLRRLPEQEGMGAVEKKIQLVSELLTAAKPLEAKYIVRTVLEEMRVGVGAGSIRDAIVWAFFEKEFGLAYDNKTNLDVVSDEDRAKYNELVEAVQRSYDITNDFAVVARSAKEHKLNGIEKTELKIGKPIKVMLFQKAEDMDDAFSRVGNPAAFEYKYDGFRMQVHGFGGKVKLFTRRLEEVTNQFPDVVDIVKKSVKSKDYIIDCEVIGIDPKTKAWLPFQNISQRIKRKYDIDELIKQVPVMVNVFDAIVVDDEILLKEPFKKRREALERVIKQIPEKIQLAKQIITSNKKEAEEFYEEALAKGNEGLMAKNLEAEYKPGSRVGYGVKIKPTLENLDLVITGADWGKGKRAHWLSSFSVSCLKGKEFLEVGKVGTGIKELEEEGVSFKQLTSILKPLITEEKGKSVLVKPKIVVEVTYGEIQKSPTYTSGYALRFPRVLNLRIDKPVNECSTIKDVERIYQKQRT